MVQYIVRALRLPFITASVLPFIFGSLISRQNFNFPGFFAGILAVVFTHLSANLINDYSDSKSGADWKDRHSYGFFGGSKLIQEGVLTEKFYLRAALFCAVISLFCVVLLALVLKSYFVVSMYFLIIILSWQYTAKPLSFSYNYLGELLLFLLLGPALVMGGYFIQTGIFPDLRSFIISLPFSFFIAAVIFANEVPDFGSDKAAGKNNLVSLCGIKRAFIFYYVLVSLGFLSILACESLGYLSLVSVFSLLLIFLALKAGSILKRDYFDKLKLIGSSKLTINIHNLVAIILILSLLI